MSILPKKFYNRPTLKVAQDLLGCFLIRKTPPFRKGGLGGFLKYKIVETEAYVGPSDLASHASRGRTERNEIMFGEPGYVYVYFTYGMHYMLNIVTEKNEYPAAVLIRAVEPIQCHCEELMRRSNLIKHIKTTRLPRSFQSLAMTIKTNGPAKLTKTLKIDKSFNKQPIYAKSRLPAGRQGLWIENREIDIKPSQIVKTTRIGVDYAKEYKHKLWRFYIKDNKFVSKK